MAYFESPLMTEREVAALLHLAPNTLAIWRCRGIDGPPYMKLGRAVRYRRTDVMSWLKSREVVGELDNGEDQFAVSR